MPYTLRNRITGDILTTTYNPDDAVKDLHDKIEQAIGRKNAGHSAVEALVLRQEVPHAPSPYVVTVTITRPPKTKP